jgi:hypothetical protein
MRAVVLCAMWTACLWAQSGGTAPAAPGAYKPLDSAARWRQYLDDTWRSEGFYLAIAATALDAQIEQDPPEWSRNPAGFGKRAASWAGIFGIQESIHHGGAALLGYDPRYLNCQCRGFFRRFGHGVKWSFVTKNSAGKVRPDLPVLLGAYGSVMIAGAWYPPPYRPLSRESLRAGNEQIYFVVGFNLISEYTPELKRILRLGH